ncbi:MAG TPA: Flp family type IVb pilin [Pseudolabrys sp.]|nr:Flp family type IVb pilin [Pseudolabrys sp.]
MTDFAPAACLRKFLRDQTGATAIEYAIIASGVAFVIVAVVFQIGTGLNQIFTNLKPGFD